jgi:hypothetical protein
MLLSLQLVQVLTGWVRKPHRGTVREMGNVKRFFVRFALVAFAIEIVLSVILVLLGVQYTGYQ